MAREQCRSILKTDSIKYLTIYNMNCRIGKSWKWMEGFEGVIRVSQFGEVQKVSSSKDTSFEEVVIAVNRKLKAVDPIEFGIELKQIRKKYTQETLAKRMGITQEYFNMIIKGKRPMTQHLANAFSNLLQQTIN